MRGPEGSDAPRCRRFRIAAAFLLAVCLGVGQGHPADVLEPVATVAVGGTPQSLAVDSCSPTGDVLVYDRSGGKLRFLNGDTLALRAESLDLPTTAYHSGLIFDPALCRAYLITTRTRWIGSLPPWTEARVHVIANRQVIGTFTINEDYNLGLVDPPDGHYDLDGLAVKYSNTEGGNPLRLIVDNTVGGTLDVVDLDAAGGQAALRQRFSYRAALEGSWQTHPGNSLALETRHETLAADDLTTTDRLYISDANHEFNNGYGWVRVLSIGHPLEPLNATLLPEIDLNATFPFGNGLQGLALGEAADQLYIASGAESFTNGFLGRIRTTGGALQTTQLTYADTGSVYADPRNGLRAFVGSYDMLFLNDPDKGLYLSLVVDGEVAGFVRLATNYDEHNGLRGMAFDPLRQRLYLAAKDGVMVVDVNEDTPPPPPPPPPPDEWIYLPMVRK